jgi:hypothetical protein
MASVSSESVKALHDRVCGSYHTVDDFRSMLLGLLPDATGTGGFLLSGEAEFRARTPCGAPSSAPYESTQDGGAAVGAGLTGQRPRPGWPTSCSREGRRPGDPPASGHLAGKQRMTSGGQWRRQDNAILVRGLPPGE